MSNICYSIIIPHYNIPTLLVRCLRSIPVREDVQVIVVDDCSPNSNQYKEQYAELSRPFLELYSTPQGGSAGRARNIGLQHAKGKWILFIDADDLLTPNAEKMLFETFNWEADVIYFNYLSVYSDDLTKKATRTENHQYFREYADNKSETSLRYFYASVVGKVIRRELMERYRIKCDETKYSNDVMCSAKLGYYAKSIAVCQEPLLLITSRNGSLASTLYENNIVIQVEELKIRLGVELAKHSFLRTKNIKVPINTYISRLFYHTHPIVFFLYIPICLSKYPMDTFSLFYELVKNKINYVRLTNSIG